MTKSDPAYIAQYREDARLDLFGEAELKWLQDEFPTLPDETHRMMQTWRVRSRQLLRKRELSHARYLRNQDTIKLKALEYQRRRQALLKQDATTEIYSKEDHREVQRWYHERNRDIINAKARARRANRKKLQLAEKATATTDKTDISSNYVFGRGGNLVATRKIGANVHQQDTRSRSSYTEGRTIREYFLWLVCLAPWSQPPCLPFPVVVSAYRRDRSQSIGLMDERDNEVLAHAEDTNDGEALNGPSKDADASVSNPHAREHGSHDALRSLPPPEDPAGTNTALGEQEKAHEEPYGDDDIEERNGQDDEDHEDDVPSGSGKGKRKNKGKCRRPGNPGNFEDEALAFLEAAYPEYEKLKRRSKESGEWLRNIIAKFIAKFPDYKISRARHTKPLSDVDLDSLTPDERKSHKRKLANRAANEREDERLAQAIRRFYHWKASDMRAKDGESVGNFLKTVVKESARPRRQQVDHYLMTHPEYKDQITSHSKETGSADRLPERRDAARKVWVEMEEGKRKEIMDEIDRNLAAALKAYGESKEGQASAETHRSRTRRSVGRIMQPIIDVLHRETGLSFVLLAGEDMDGQGLFDSATLSASPPGTPKITQYNVDKFQSFIGFFYHYLRMIRHPVTNNTNETSVSMPDNSSSNSEVTPANLNKRRRQVSKRAEDDDGTSSDEEEDELSNKGGDEDAYGGVADDEDGLHSEEEIGEDGSKEIEEHEYPKGSYMAERAENIRRNQALLKSLGLDRSIFASAKPKTSTTSNSRSSSSSGLQRRSARLNKKSSEMDDASVDASLSMGQDGQEEDAQLPGVVNDWAETVLSESRHRVLAECQRFIDDDPAVTTGTLTDLVVGLTPDNSVARTAWVSHISKLGEVWREREEDPLGNIDWPAPPDAELLASDVSPAAALPEPITATIITTTIDEDIQLPAGSDAAAALEDTTSVPINSRTSSTTTLALQHGNKDENPIPDSLPASPPDNSNSKSPVPAIVTDSDAHSQEVVDRVRGGDCPKSVCIRAWRTRKQDNSMVRGISDWNTDEILRSATT
ncbi:hypothetical protein VNI00_018406 [Paramarasmius palmivorus]|uniref:Uncharacterized protein n=1 Tax=Paramarasmius palmivorus TaxID=297713 RepID=A0AAW0AXM8_9AGAR